MALTVVEEEVVDYGGLDPFQVSRSCPVNKLDTSGYANYNTIPSGTTGVENTILYRKGRGVITDLITPSVLYITIWVDGVLFAEKEGQDTSGTTRIIGTAEEIRYLPYSSSIEIYGTSIGTSTSTGTLQHLMTGV